MSKTPLQAAFAMIWRSGTGALACTAALVAGSCSDLFGPHKKPSSRIDPNSLLVWRNPDVSASLRVIVSDSAVYALTANHTVAAMRKSDGRTLWKTTLPTTIPGRNGEGLALASGALIVGDMDVFALDRGTGAVRWRFSPSIGFAPGYSALTTDGTMIFCGSMSGHVYAVDAATSQEKWVADVAHDSATNVYSPTLSNGVVYVGFTRFNPFPASDGGGMAAVDAASGRVLWSRDLSHAAPNDWLGVFSIVVTPTVVMTLAENGTAYGLDRSTGEIRFITPASTFNPRGIQFNPVTLNDLSSVAVGGDLILAGSSALQSLTALSAQDMHRVWGVAFRWGSVTGVGVDDSRVYAGAPGGQFGVFDRGTGALIWWVERYDLRPNDGQEGLYLAPAIDTDRIYLGGQHEVYAFTKR